VSPDGTRAALDVRDQDNDIWIWDFARQTLARFTFNQGPDENATWTPDGKRIAFTSTNLGNAGLNWQAADGTGAAEKLLGVASMLLRYPWAFTSDGKWLIVRDADSKTGTDLALLRIDDKRIQPLVQQTGNQTNPDLSPDGRWLAYQSDESGRNEIYVRPFPSVDAGRWQVSTSGGSRPVWARNGRELFYLDDRFRLIAVPVQGGATFAGGNPVMLFDLPSTPTATARTYDVAPDGRFLVIKFQQADKSSNEPMLNVVLNWSDELKRLVPQAK